MRTKPLAVGLAVILGLGVLLGLGGPASGQETPSAPDPVWKRLGLPESPTPDSGRGVGVVLLDDAGLHPALRPLGGRLKHVVVDPGMNVSLIEPLRDDKPGGDGEYTHGVRALLQMAASPFRVGDQTHCGVAPGATYFVVPYRAGRRDDTRLDRAVAWVVENRVRWNIRVILLETWFEDPPPTPQDPARDGLIRNTKEYPTVRALEPAVKAGVLVVTGNGNTGTLNNGPPAEYLAVGAYHDSGRAARESHRENPDEPWGRNGDGHARPDVLAPKYFVPNHRTPGGEIQYFGGTSSASAQVAALCALLFARFPGADAAAVQHALIRSGDPLPGSRRPGVRVNAARAIRALENGPTGPPWPRATPPVTVTDPNLSLESKDGVERALAVSDLARHPERFRPQGGDGLRRVFWRLLHDESPAVRKAAASALGVPETDEERARFWEAVRRERDMGVRGQFALLLLDGAGADRLGDWVALAKDPNWTARWCVAKVLRQHHPDAPPLDLAFLPEDVETKAEPVFTWYRKKDPSGKGDATPGSGR